MTTQTATEYALEISLQTFRLVVSGPLFERACAGLPLPTVAEMGGDDMTEEAFRMLEQAARCWTAIQAIRTAQAETTVGRA
jgi:hypothetical protein